MLVNKACSLTLLTAGFGGRHRPPLAGLIVQHGGRGVFWRAWGADVLVCVVVVVLVLLLRGCRWQRLGGFRGVKSSPPLCNGFYPFDRDLSLKALMACVQSSSVLY